MYFPAIKNQSNRNNERFLRMQVQKKLVVGLCVENIDMITALRRFIERIKKHFYHKELAYLAVAISAYLLYSYFDRNTFLNIVYNILEIVPARGEERKFHGLIVRHLSPIIFLFLLPIAASLLIERKKQVLPDKLGLKLKNKKMGFSVLSVSFLVMAIAIFIATRIFPSFKTYYPYSELVKYSIQAFIVYEIFRFLYFIGWEFFFDSFLLFPYKEKMGSFAIFMSIIPFVMVHIGKPGPEVVGSFFGALFLTILSYETESFWYSMLLHGTVAVTMDAMVVFL